MIKILNYADVSPEEVFARSEQSADVSAVVSDIIEDVRKNGDEAIIRYAARFDGIDPEGFALELTEDDKDNALAQALAIFPEIKKVCGKKAIEYGLLHRLDGLHPCPDRRVQRDHHGNSAGQ